MVDAPSVAQAAFDVVAASELFRGVPREALEPIRDALEEVDLPAGATLFTEGDAGDALYVVRAGRLIGRARSSAGNVVAVGDFEPGGCVGEMALLSGRPRTATVTAETDARLVRLRKETFDRLVDAAPGLARTLAEAIGMRFHTQLVARPLANLFGDLSVEQVRAFHRRLAWVRLAPGDVLFRAGEPGDAVYLVLGGRLRAVDDRPDGTRRVVNEIVPGEAVGELALLTGSPRSLTVEAMRETHLARLAAPDFDALIDRHPRVLKPLARLAFDRKRRATRRDGGPAAGDSLSICLLPDPALAPPRFVDFVERFTGALDRAGGSTLLLTAERFDAAFGRAGACRTPADHPLAVTIAGWLSEQEARHRTVVYVPDAADSAWTDRCLAQADRLLVVADAASDPNPSMLERRATARCLATTRELVLLHDAETARPTGTAAWLAKRDVAAHHHVRVGRDADAASAARRVTGRAIGIVLSGGAARGFAHIGVLRALDEAGWPIDVLGGTSMGAVIGAAWAVGHDYAGMVNLARSFGDRRRLFDVTPPLVSFLASKKVSAAYQQMYGDRCIEDLWRPFFCVSTNLTRARPFLHDRGELWRAVRASSSIAGLFAPVAWSGDLLVDGATMNNWPVDLMRARCPAGTVVAIHVNPEVDQSVQYDYGPHLSGFAALRHLATSWLRRTPSPINVPFIGSIMTELSLVNDAMATDEKRALADLVIVPDVRAFNPLNFALADPIIEAGYVAARAALADVAAPARASVDGRAAAAEARAPTSVPSPR